MSQGSPTLRVTLGTLAILLLASGPAAAEDAAQERSAKDAIRAADQLARTEFTRLKREMGTLRMKGEAADCDRILERCRAPSRSSLSWGGSSRWPGEETYFLRVLDRFAAVGDTLTAAYAEVPPLLADAPERAECYAHLARWLASFSEIAKRMKHFNGRRAACGLGPVTCSFAASYAGYRHGQYRWRNRRDPAFRRSSPHRESSDLPGYSREGAWGAHGVGGDGWFDEWMGSVYHRDPVFDPHLSRIAFGGYRESWWCRALGEGNKRTIDLLTWPPAGAKRIRPDFTGESPNPLPPGIRHCGALIVIQFFKGQPDDFRYRLLDREGREIRDLLVFEKGRTHVFASRKRLHWGTYTVQLMGTNYFYEFTFSTDGA